MRGLRLALPLLAGLLAGCQLLDLDRQLHSAQRELLLVPGQLQGERQALVVLLDANDALVGYRIVAPDEQFYFSVERGDYRLLAFVDDNHNFRLDPGEPRHFLPAADAVALRLQPTPAQRAELAGLNRLAPRRDDGSVVPAADLSLGRLYREHPRLRHNYLQVVEFDDPRFDPARIEQGAWRPLDFVREVGYGLYLLRPWQAGREPVVLVHGINDSPRSWRQLAAAIDPQRFQVLLYHYPSGSPLNNSAYLLSEALRDVQLRHGAPRFHLLAHSMGGLVARRSVQLLGPGGDSADLCLFMTLSTPWDGHPAAARGVARAPVVAPVWRDMAPGSRYLQELFATPLPAQARHWLLASYQPGGRQPSDGVVPLASQLRAAAQDGAQRLFVLEESHTGILLSQRSQALLRRALDELPAAGCGP
jgi:pimeloyl-ACP methyl ester carboxylesterase